MAESCREPHRDGKNRNDRTGYLTEHIKCPVTSQSRTSLSGMSPPSRDSLEGGAKLSLQAVGSCCAPPVAVSGSGVVSQDRGGGTTSRST